MTNAEKVSNALSLGQFLIAFLILIGFNVKSMTITPLSHSWIILLLIVGGWACTLYAAYLSHRKLEVPTAGSEAAKKWIATPMTSVYRRKFHNEQVQLDGFNFVDCEFGPGVAFVYSGLKHFAITNSQPTAGFTWHLETNNVSIQCLLRFFEQTRVIAGQLSIKPPPLISN